MEDLVMSPQAIKIIFLKNSDSYLIGRVTELDEEPSILIENCYKIVECAEYGENPDDLKARAISLEGNHLKIAAKKIDESTNKEWYVYEYIILEKFPKYSSQRDLFLTSDSILTILDPEQAVQALYEKISG